MDLTRLHRCMDLLSRGATEGPGVAGHVGLYLGGRCESVFAPGLVRAARRELAQAAQPALAPHSNPMAPPAKDSPA